MGGTLSAIQTNEVIGLDDSTSSCQLISNTHHRRMTNPQSFGDPAVAEFRRFPDLRSYDLSFCHRSQLPSRQVEGPDQRPFFRHFSPNPTAFRRKALSEQMLAMISASASNNRSSERLSLIDRRTVEASAKGNYRPLAASPSPSCSRRLSGSARSVAENRCGNPELSQPIPGS